MKIEYLLFNLVIVTLSTFSVLVYKRTKLPNSRVAIPAILLIILPYLIWDSFVTGLWWNFNDAYILGIRLFSLPIEEILFFLTVPWSCLVVWESLSFMEHKRLPIVIEPIVFFLSMLIAVYAGTKAWWYTLTVGLILCLFSVLSTLNGYWLSTKKSSLYILIVVMLTVFFNGYLTARPVVVYAQTYMSSLRFFSIPLEDLAYGIVLVGSVALLYDHFSKRQVV